MKNSNRRYIPAIFAALSAIALAALASCGDESDTAGGTKQHEVVFYSAANPGPWIEQAADHEPEIIITRVDDRKILNVNVPFAQRKERNHFVEVVVILDSKRKELKKVTFQKGRSHKGAQFDFPEDFNAPVYVVMKCNKHDMWEKLVDWSEEE